MIRAASAHPALPAVRDIYARRTRAVRYQSQSPSSLQPANLRPTRQARRINRRPQAAGHRSSFMPDIDKWPQPLDQMRFRKTFYYFFHAARNRITGLSRHLHHLASIEVEPVTFFQSVGLTYPEYDIHLILPMISRRLRPPAPAFSTSRDPRSNPASHARLSHARSPPPAPLPHAYC